MLRTDGQAAAEALTAAWPEPRAGRFWDGGRAIGTAFQATLALPYAAWDVYCLYPRGVRWVDPLPPPPAFWRLQTTDPRIDRRWGLDAGAFTDRVGELLSQGRSSGTKWEITRQLPSS